MNIVNAGSRYQIYGEDLNTFKTLPIASYDVNFNKMQGFFLTSRPALEVNEDKIYGSSERKVAKVLDSFQDFNRNLGVILSGQKGIGKSLFARILAIKSIERQIPLINISEYIPGIASFLGSIEQEVIVLFDEFEKTFAPNDGGNPQEELLSLFDGIDSGKKLFVITCNEVNKLNSYLINRPGRFHYHFSLTPPSAEEVNEYMMDKLMPQHHGLISEIVNFCLYAEMSYDCLRAIAFELNHGYSLKETLNDLNITKMNTPKYTVSVIFNDGTSIESYRGENIDLFSTRKVHIWLNYKDYACFCVGFTPRDVKVDYTTGVISLDPSNVKITYDEEYMQDMGEIEATYLKSLTIGNIILSRDSRSDASRYTL